jgi:uncharacterized membrane protein YbhN (UPF0104 family)
MTLGTDSYKTSTGSGLRRYRGIATIVGLAVFVVSVWYVGRTFQWRELAQLLKDVNLTCLLVGGSASILFYWLLRSLRWLILLRRTGTHVPFVDLYLCTAVSLTFSLFTPLQSGEMLKIELLKKYSLIQRAPGYGSFLVERALDLVILLAIACVSLLTVLGILQNSAYAYGILGCLVLACIVGLIVLTKLRLRGRLQQLLEHMRQCVGDMPTLLLITIITCISWASVAFTWQVFLYSGGIHLGFDRTMALMSIMALISILSLIPGGIGISEAGTSQLLMHFGFVATVAQAGSIVLRSSSLVAIFLGGVHLGIWKLVRYRRNRHIAAATAEATHG